VRHDHWLYSAQDISKAALRTHKHNFAQPFVSTCSQIYEKRFKHHKMRLVVRATSIWMCDRLRRFKPKFACKPQTQPQLFACKAAHAAPTIRLQSCTSRRHILLHQSARLALGKSLFADAAWTAGRVLLRWRPLTYPQPTPANAPSEFLRHRAFFTQM